MGHRMFMKSAHQRIGPHTTVDDLAELGKKICCSMIHKRIAHRIERCSPVGIRTRHNPSWGTNI